jgi:hypothetical protein
VLPQLLVQHGERQLGAHFTKCRPAAFRNSRKSVQPVTITVQTCCLLVYRMLRRGPAELPCTARLYGAWLGLWGGRGAQGRVTEAAQGSQGGRREV